MKFLGTSADRLRGNESPSWEVGMVLMIKSYLLYETGVSDDYLVLRRFFCSSGIPTFYHDCPIRDEGNDERLVDVRFRRGRFESRQRL
jgi:hypothetical protein